jgi:hypothetical protein
MFVRELEDLEDVVVLVQESRTSSDLQKIRDQC